MINILSATSQGYFALFIAMLFVGPLATLPAAFAATFGVFNIWIVFVLCLLGNVLANFFYFYMGVWGREAIIEKYGHYFGLTKERILRIEQQLHKHAVKTITALKLLPFTVPALAIPGAMRMPFRRFARISIAITVPESLALIILGYYSGLAVSTMIKYVHRAEFIFLGFVIIFLSIWLVILAYEKFLRKEFKDYE